VISNTVKAMTGLESDSYWPREQLLSKATNRLFVSHKQLAPCQKRSLSTQCDGSLLAWADCMALRPSSGDFLQSNESESQFHSTVAYDMQLLIKNHLIKQNIAI